jgi:mono/diheme cytochrome c family protein
VTGGLKWTGFLATGVIVLLIGLNIMREPARQEQARQTYQETAVASGIDLYAVNCARCHGAAGEGLGVYRGLDQPFIVNKNPRELQTIIQYGRYATDMAAFGLDQGGSLTSTQVNDLVMMLQQAKWEVVEARVEALGMTPLEEDILAAQRSARTVTVEQQAIDIDVLTNTLPVYVEQCSECHGEQGQGTSDGPQLNNAYVRGMSAAQLAEKIELGVRNTEMEGFADRLSQEQISGMIMLLQNWPLLNGQESMQFAEAPIATRAEIAAVTETGAQLFGMWCGICHGMAGEGGGIAPSLNDIPDLPAEFLASRIRTGKKAMPPFTESNLSNGQMALVIEYAQANIIGSGLPAFSTDELSQGQTLYVQQCAECHGEAGEGIADSGPRIVTLPPMRASQIINFTRVGSLETPAIPSSVVSDNDLRLIVAYIHSLSQ